jgi:hypothetical protein
LAVAQTVTPDVQAPAFRWALCLAREDAGSLARIRLIPAIEVGEAGPALWLRGQPGDESLSRALRALPALARYEWRTDGLLRRLEDRVPSAKIPGLDWQPLAAWLGVEAASAALPASRPRPVPLRLVRSATEREPDLLLTCLEAWSQFVSKAPRVRLDRLQFAAAGDTRVLVRGRPLPPLPGPRFAACGGIAVPAGYAWQPAVSVEVLARRLGIGADALVLWHEDGGIERLHSDHFVPATPSAVRATLEAIAEIA